MIIVESSNTNPARIAGMYASAVSNTINAAPAAALRVLPVVLIALPSTHSLARNCASRFCASA